MTLVAFIRSDGKLVWNIRDVAKNTSVTFDTENPEDFELMARELLNAAAEFRTKNDVSQ